MSASKRYFLSVLVSAVCLYTDSANAEFMNPFQSDKVKSISENSDSKSVEKRYPPAAQPAAAAPAESPAPAVDESKFKILQEDPAVISEVAPTPYVPQGNSVAVNSISISGNKRVERETVISYLGFKEGENVDRSLISEALKRLYSTGMFSSVDIQEDMGVMTINVTENSAIGKIAFEGNKRIKDEDLNKEVELKARSIFSQAKVQSDVARIQEMYRRNGRYSATITPKIIEREKNTVDLVYEINEGPVAEVRKIFFVGSKAYTPHVLRKIIRTEETSWYQFLTDNDKYDQDRTNFDKELLRKFYTDRGYADFQVKSVNAELSPQQDAFYLTYTIDEGERYNFGKVGVESKLKGVNIDTLQKLLTTKEGEIYNGSKIEDGVDAIIKNLGDDGFAFVNVDPLIRKQPGNKIEIAYAINEAPRVYVERINITGNTRTLDSVLRREMRLAEGDPYSASKLKRSEQRLNNLGYFESVKISTSRGAAPDKAEINIQVAEKSTGELSFGGGFSTTDGLLGEVGIRENNLLGKGQQVKLKTTLSGVRQEINLGFTEPYFLNRDLAAGFDIFRTLYDYRTQSSFNQDSRGIVLRMGYPVTENLRHSLNYTLRGDDVTDVKETASRYIRDQEGSRVISSIGHSLGWDHRDNRFEPTDGYYVKFSQDLAGLGGDAHFLRNEINASYYYPWAKNWVTRLATVGGYTYGFGDDDVAIQDRFFIGGSNFRGFKRAGIGPRDTTTTDALGSNQYYVNTIEQSFPIGLPDDLGITAAAFLDAGSSWSLDDNTRIFDNGDTLRAAAGVGLYWRSPFGPVRIDYAQPISKGKYDEEERINFSFGTKF